VSFEDIIKRNRAALGMPPTPDYIEPTSYEVLTTRCCPTCGGKLRLLGVQRLHQNQSVFRLPTYHCLPCMRTVELPHPMLIALAFAAGLLFAVFAVVSYAKIANVAAGDETKLAIGFGALGAIALFWAGAALRRTRRSQPR